MSVDEILNLNPEALDLLDTVKDFHSEDYSVISEVVKPYMDSTATNHGASANGMNFAAWPLVAEVDIFVKSDLLQNGVVLVDLPGLGDAVESREAVAKRYFDQLAATIIMSQATRAADNATAAHLMSKYQEMAMMLNGKFHKQGFCVCVTQIDQIDRRAALRKADAKDNAELQGWLQKENELKLLLKAMEAERKHIRGRMKVGCRMSQSRRLENAGTSQQANMSSHKDLVLSTNSYFK
ncbi:hypothetical protein GGS20DRAFT_568907 [Poronia punctata]|nr:hypothetical protein GGS20DRAFT_568907 [Poronia punctata]